MQAACKYCSTLLLASLKFELAASSPALVKLERALDALFESFGVRGAVPPTPLTPRRYAAPPVEDGSNNVRALLGMFTYVSELVLDHVCIVSSLFYISY